MVLSGLAGMHVQPVLENFASSFLLLAPSAVAGGLARSWQGEAGSWLPLAPGILVQDRACSSGG
jgi:hypothetical protein